MKFDSNKSFAKKEDIKDQLKHFREKFYIPKNKNKENLIYFCGNSLGLQPKAVPEVLKKELEVWQEKGVLGQEDRWINYHERLTNSSASVVGAKASEVVIMNALTVNIHLLLVSFYRPKKNRYKIIIEKGAFPSDQYAVESQLEFHGYDKKDALIEIEPIKGKEVIDDEEILNILKKNGSETALIYLGGINYFSGQLFDMKSITKSAKKYGVTVGFNLAHCAGNVELFLHKWGVDFASWCTYKYLCAGPGSPSGIFVHENHHNWTGPRFTGWWGHNKKDRFEMPLKFNPIKTAEGWQISNAPIMGMAPLIASMNLYDSASMEKVRKKGIRLTAYLEFLLNTFLPEIIIVTPEKKGSQISIKVKNGKSLFNDIIQKGLICDWREPNVIRLAPHPLFNSYEEVYRAIMLIKSVYK
ncbi:kynureninase [Candidatus Marinimicrobia bacterium]|jgi:kynureninase|nr:kynureninase [Candidatus Neomarinimicrobiota bacterium]